ncbi:hypothetical protein NTE_02115 [Candidatus Nitrososphaera evergladensis SR1]|uniref:DUF5615 domain-containing protein n=1 Tax=Candidatus Nitrososphaera evergladensis SR1 TaxID=1459636 RepID=A0A075MSQ1_9ARCH|nr:DUF5615 family PIN-like protein [Candidatus Nitrososphaera evergladensis]AIF84170.1 hypothetical protein NTE_02115 [Candidatus Nitrososphaera evergladensis SR1]
MIKVETPCKRLLLDECVTRRLVLRLPKSANIDIEHSLDVAGLGMAASDDDILAYAIKTNRTIVTIDRKFIRECLIKKVPVATYDKGTARFHGSGESLWLGKHYEYRKVSVRLIEAEKKTLMGNVRNCVYGSRRHIRKHIRPVILLYRKLKAMTPQGRRSKCKVCGIQHRSPQRLQNHLRNTKCGRTNTARKSKTC